MSNIKIDNTYQYFFNAIIAQCVNILIIINKIDIKY